MKTLSYFFEYTNQNDAPVGMQETGPLNIPTVCKITNRIKFGLAVEIITSGTM